MFVPLLTTWKCVPLVDLLITLLWAGRNGLPPTPDILHLGCSYLHSSHRFLSILGAVMLKTEIVVKSFFCNTLHTGFTIFCCYWTSISHFTTYQNNYHSLFTHVLQAIQNLTQNFVCQLQMQFFYPITTFLLFQQYTGRLFLHNYTICHNCITDGVNASCLPGTIHTY